MRIETPHLDAASFSTKDRERYELAKLTLEQALESQKIWNTEYNDAKYWLHSVIEGECHRLADVIWSTPEYQTLREKDDRTDPVWVRYYEDVDMFFNWVSAAKQLRGLNKMPMTPALTEYKGIIEDAVKLNDALKQLKPYIQKGRKPSESPVEVDLSNTGICPVCDRRQKLTIDGKLVAHGYKIAWGSRNGICLGAGHMAYELSAEGAEAYLNMLQHILPSYEVRVKNLTGGKIKEFMRDVRVREGYGVYRYEKQAVKEGQPEFEQILASAILLAEHELESLKRDIQSFKSRVANWKLEPLKYGGAETQERWKDQIRNAK